MISATLMRSSGQNDLFGYFLNGTMNELHYAVQSEDLGKIEKVLKAIAQSPPKYLSEILSNDTIYSKVVSLIAHEKYELAFGIIRLSREFHLSTNTFDLCEAALLLQLKETNFEQQIAALIAPLEQPLTLLTTLYSQSSPPLSNYYSELHEFILNHMHAEIG